MGWLPGTPYEPSFHLTIPPEKLGNTITDLAKFLIRISDHPFRGVGSLYANPGATEWTVGPLITRLVVNNQPPHYSGPFLTAGEKWGSILDFRLEAIRSKWVHHDRRELASCVFSWMRDAMLAYQPYNIVGEDTFLFHEDAKWDTILADEDGHITGLIDWEW
jgi:hypothetical protein